MSKYIKLEDAIDAVMNTEAVFADVTAEPYQKTRDVTQALHNLPTIEVIEDCISRGKLISDLADIWEDGYTPNLPRTMLDFQDMLEDINYKIRNAPSVVPKPKEGDWIRTFDGNEWYWYCSNCKEQWYEDDLYMGGNEFPHYCPNCGADMRGDNDGKDIQSTDER